MTVLYCSLVFICFVSLYWAALRLGQTSHCDIDVNYCISTDTLAAGVFLQLHDQLLIQLYSYLFLSLSLSRSHTHTHNADTITAGG